jgi:ABC-type phosphate transport system auxiliary subunit
MHEVASWIWVFIPITAIGIAPFKMWIRMKERQLTMQSELTAEKTAQYAAHTERLEQRVRVLERIATDKGTDLSDQIEALRTAQLPDPQRDQA